MARGKAAAQAANRRAAAAAESAAELTEKYKAERAEWQAERVQLKAEIGRLRFNLDSGIENAARERLEQLCRKNAQEFLLLMEREKAYAREVDHIISRNVSIPESKRIIAEVNRLFNHLFEEAS